MTVHGERCGVRTSRRCGSVLLQREWALRECLGEGIREVDTERRRLLRRSDEPAVTQMRQLMTLKGIGG